MKKSDPPIIVETLYDAPITLVWNALTKVEEMKQWFFPQINAFRAELGFKTEFAVAVEENRFTHLWEILEVKQNRLLKYSWRYLEYKGDSYIEFELKELENKTRLKVTAVVLEDFPSDIPEFKRESCIGGWNYFIRESLKNYLESS